MANYEAPELCYECDGDGVCWVCEGSGQLMGKTCSFCNGHGYCPVCNGYGLLNRGTHERVECEEKERQAAYEAKYSIPKHKKE